MTGKPLGRFYAVGLGPGDPELLTRKAERILREVDWIFLPGESARQVSFAGAILAPLGLPADKFRSVSLCMTREPGINSDRYRSAAREIIEGLHAGKSIAWATEGDPLFYSTFLQLRQRLLEVAPDLEIEVVPGISSVNAAAARVGMPVAVRDEKVAIVPATYGIDCLPKLLAEFATVFLLKVHLVFDQLLDMLGTADMACEGCYLENIGTDRERVVHDLESLRGQKLPYFSLVILRKLAGET